MAMRGSFGEGKEGETDKFSFWSTYLRFGNGRGGHATTDYHDNTEQLGWSEVMQKFHDQRTLVLNLLSMTPKSAEDLVFRLWRQA